MTSALLYLQYHSLLNRLRSRIRRLKKPKYLVAAVVGGLYFYWYFFRFFFHSAGRFDAWGGITGCARVVRHRFPELAGPA
jgi:hypothetical protein